MREQMERTADEILKDVDRILDDSGSILAKDISNNFQDLINDIKSLATKYYMNFDGDTYVTLSSISSDLVGLSNRFMDLYGGE